MSMPSVVFVLDKELDKEMAWRFYRRRRHGGVDFWKKGAARHHEALTKLPRQKSKRRFIEQYVSALYGEHSHEFKKRVLAIEDMFRSRTTTFFRATESIFGGYPWPKGRYKVYGSIFDFGPRFLAEKSFQVFLYDRDEIVLWSIYHEMLHFIFYDYCLVRHPDIFQGRDTESGSFWKLAELFNAVILQTRPFATLFGTPAGVGYPEIAKYYAHARRIWRGNLDNWIENMDAVIKRDVAIQD